MFRQAILCLLFFGAPFLAWGQQWGIGQWGGMQSCGNQIRAGDGASSEMDGVQEAQKALSEAKRRLREKQTALRKIEKELDRIKETVTKTIDMDFAETLFAHIDNKRTCDEYKCADASCVSPYKREEWDPICDGQRIGAVNGREACRLPRSRTEDRTRGDGGSCAEALGKYAKKSAEQRKAQRELEQAEAAVEKQTQELQTAKDDRIEEMKEKQRAQAEGGVCVECMMNQRGGPSAPRNTDWASVVSNVGVGLLATYMGYQTNKMISTNNSALGWPTQSYPAWGYGMPYFANGIYGAMGGGTGAGAFGCGGGSMGGMNGMMNGGAFGYPQNMMGGSMSGGMYLPGMSPWGMNGPGGMGMYGMNGMGTMMSGGMMSPYGTMMSGGMMSPYGTMMSGGMMSPYGTMMSGGMMSSYGTMMSSGMMSPYGTMMSSGMMSPYGTMMSGLMMNGLSSTTQLQYQQQIMQIQMQQQQRAYSDAIQRSQVSAQIQTEIYGLMSRLQQIQYGGTYNFGLSGIYGTTGTGVLGTTGLGTVSSGISITPSSGR